MTQEEFHQLIREFGLSVPSFLEWLNRLPDPAATKLTWFDEVFWSLDLQDCRNVTSLVTRGQLDAPPFSTLPAFFSRHSRAVAFEREEKQRNPLERESSVVSWVEAEGKHYGTPRKLWDKDARCWKPNPIYERKAANYETTTCGHVVGSMDFEGNQNGHELR